MNDESPINLDGGLKCFGQSKDLGREYEQRKRVAELKHRRKSMKLGMNHPMVPLELADFVGLDTLLFCMDNLY